MVYNASMFFIFIPQPWRRKKTVRLLKWTPVHCQIWTQTIVWTPLCKVCVCVCVCVRACYGESIWLFCLHLGDAMIFAHELLCDVTNNFAKERLIGKGGFGSVYCARLRHADVAIKVLNTVSI